MITFSQFLSEAKKKKEEESYPKTYTLGPAPEYTKPGSKARKKQVAKLILKHSGGSAFKKNKVEEQIGIEYSTPYNQSIAKSAGIAKRRQISHTHGEMERAATQQRKAHIKRIQQLETDI